MRRLRCIDTWARDLEARALTEVSGHTFVILQPHLAQTPGELIRTAHVFASDERRVVLSFHPEYPLGDHYNSVHILDKDAHVTKGTFGMALLDELLSHECTPDVQVADAGVEIPRSSTSVTSQAHEETHCRAGLITPEHHAHQCRLLSPPPVPHTVRHVATTPSTWHLPSAAGCEWLAFS